MMKTRAKAEFGDRSSKFVNPLPLLLLISSPPLVGLSSRIRITRGMEDDDGQLAVCKAFLRLSFVKPIFTFQL